VEQWRTLSAPVETILPVLTEALYLLDFSRTAVEAVFDLVETGALKVLPIGLDDLVRVRELMAKYSDIPMDFADACLVRVAEREAVVHVFTVDRRGFTVFAPKHVRRLKLLPATLD
jgi:predicted nucleic acid-binding protein